MPDLLALSDSEREPHEQPRHACTQQLTFAPRGRTPIRSPQTQLSCSSVRVQSA
jgi:hypothetical protein